MPEDFPLKMKNQTTNMVFSLTPKKLQKQHVHRAQDTDKKIHRKVSQKTIVEKLSLSGEIIQLHNLIIPSFFSEVKKNAARVDCVRRF